MKSTLFLSAATLFFSAAQAQVADTTNRNTGTTNQTTGTTQTVGTTGTTDSVGGNMGTGTAQVGVDNARRLNQYGSYSTRDSIAAKYKLQPMPGALTIEKTFPILGTYQLNTTPGAAGITGSTDATTATGTTGTTNTTGNTTTGTVNNSGNTMNATDASAAYGAQQITITLDSASKGIVWVEGLQQGRMKAYLKKSPATYRVVAQKSATGTAIPEGTMHLDSTTNTLHIALGVPYNDVDPTAIFAVSDSTASVDNTAEVKVKTKDSKTNKTTKSKSKVVFITATKVDAAMQQDATQQGTDAGTIQQNNQQQ
ncbi:hypothetical protein SAMN05444008_109212 [Cnuella takakiae]|uniref:Uncharacterized protein n=1 Tax=Cnuella takakiae TaxID=1302690 RepID=A0A1M5CTW3_9BACT|nr:hypothetical protein [Cnuella takakiae]SHF58116.1 hypothetical protein SAMN05444008_109212 [Cnuella takakiae]